MLHPLKYIFTGLLLTILLASCSSDAEAPDVSADGMMLSVSVRTAGVLEGYEAGSLYENYINDCRIYFFDEENKFITEFKPDLFLNELGSQTEYRMEGKVPDVLVRVTDFKVVILANWPTPPSTLIKGETTIEDICNAETATFSGPKRALSRTDLMPFYGVHHYTNVVFKPHQTITLPNPITLLRAMAKVEVMLGAEMEDVEVTSLKLHRYHTKGYCAPLNVFSQTDYGQGQDWANDYLKDEYLHVATDALESDEKLDFQETVDANGKKKWVLYVPEYKNRGVGDDYSCIEMKFDFQEETDEPYVIHFATYEGGTTDITDNAKRMNIERNNLYRFSVTVNGRFIVVANSWTNVFENEFEF